MRWRVVFWLLPAALAGCSFEFPFDQSIDLTTGRADLAIARAVTNVNGEDVQKAVDGLSKFGEVESLVLDGAWIQTNPGDDLSAVEYAEIILSNSSRMQRYDVLNPAGTNASITLDGAVLLWFYQNPPFDVHAVLYRDEAGSVIPTHYRVRLKGRMLVEALVKP
ncbi:MAG TPA: hypothetical protein PK297_08100 [Spirochaetota bacterium]|nr:hypothetical protein [Spirochaetota bacterium]